MNSELAAIGYELVSCSIRGSKGRPLLDVRIDRADLAPVTVDDCARASRALEARLDEDGSLGERYVLEVSSAGVERPLRTLAEWRRFIGREASVVADAVGGRAELRIVAVDGDRIVVEDTKGAQHRLSISEIRDARLVFHWQR